MTGFPNQGRSKFQDEQELFNYVTGGESIADGEIRVGPGGLSRSRVRTAVALVGDTSAQSYLPAADNAFAVRENTAYRFLTHVHLITGATTHTTGWGITLTTATLNAILGIAEAQSAADDTLAAWQVKQIDQAAVTVLTVTSTAVETIIRVSGTIEVLVAGTITPFVQFSADPAGDETAEPGTFFEIWPIGPYNQAAQGNFS